jgi:hypothetical protein
MNLSSVINKTANYGVANSSTSQYAITQNKNPPTPQYPNTVASSVGGMLEEWNPYFKWGLAALLVYIVIKKK